MLVLALAGVGDVLMTTPLLKELRAAFPAAVIDVLVMQGEPARDVLSGNPNVNNVVLHNFMREPFWRSLRFCLELRRRRYDCSITAFPLNRLAYNLITFLVGARTRIGFDYAIPCGALGRWLLTDRLAERTDIHVVENNLRILPEVFERPLRETTHRLGLALSADNHRFADEFMARLGLDNGPAIGLHPGSGTTKNLALRRWAPEKWAQLAQGLATQYPTATLFMFGAAAEKDLRTEIQALSGLDGKRLVSVDAGGLRDAAALIGRMRCFVCCDTLLTHIAAASGVPTIEILGPTPPQSIYPYGVPYRIVRTGISCSPCYGYSRFGIRCTNPVFLQCLKDLTPDMVLAAAVDIMAV